MAVFRYQAYDAEQKRVRGLIESDSPKLARQKLRAQGLMPIEVSESRGRQRVSEPLSALTGKGSKSLKLRLAELTLLTRQLASLVEAGFPLEEALQAVAEQSEREKVRMLLLSLRASVLEGNAFSESLAAWPSVFPGIYLAAIKAGENSGHLDVILEELANYLERRSAVRQKLQQALVYPSVVTVVCVSIVTFLLIYVVPKMVHVFTSMHVALPMVTVVLIAISHFLATKGFYLLATVLAIIWLTRYALRDPKVSEHRDRWLLKLPLVGRMLCRVNTMRFCQTLGMLLGAGVPLLESMKIAQGMVQNHQLNAGLVAAGHDVKEGQSLQLSLKRTQFFPPMSLHLIASGEASSRLSEMLTRAAQQQENELTRLIDLGLTLFEPAMILVMGGVVLFIVLAVLLPIFSMDQLISLG